MCIIYTEEQNLKRSSNNVNLRPYFTSKIEMCNFISGTFYKVTPSRKLLLWKSDVFLFNCSGMRRTKHFYLSTTLIKNGIIREVSTLPGLMSTLTQLYNTWLYWKQICDLASGIRESVYCCQYTHRCRTWPYIAHNLLIHPFIHLSFHPYIRPHTRLTLAPHSSDLFKKSSSTDNGKQQLNGENPVLYIERIVA